MKIRFATPVAVAATAVLLLGACSDDEPTTSDDVTTTSEVTTTFPEGVRILAKGEVTFAQSADLLHGQTMDITAVEQDGQVTGEARFSFGLELDLQCANTEGLLIVGGEATAERGEGEVGDRVAVIIREGDPDSVFLWYERPLPEGEVAAGSCQEFVDAIAEDPTTDDAFADLAEGDDIETG